MIRATRNTADNLVITADNESRHDLAEAYFAGGYARAEDYAVHDVCDNSDLMFIPPNAIGALTEAPIIGEAVVNDSGEYEVFGSIWWYPDYQVVDPWEQLKNKGRVVFTKAA